MFSSLKNKPFLKREAFIKKAAFLTLALFLSAGLLFISCSDNANSSGDLNGTWDDGWNPVIIDSSAKTIVYTGSYEGVIANAPNGYTAKSGVLIIQFTKYANFGAGTPSTSHANVGKYGALYWTELTASSVRLADAYNTTTWVHVMYPTLAEANAAFTPAADKVGTYVDWSPTAPYTKK
jgi:hypothetical protein